MRHMILKLNLVAILLLFESFVKADNIHKGIIQNSEAVEIKENHIRKLSNGGYIKLYYNSDVNYAAGFINGTKEYRGNISYIINNGGRITGDAVLNVGAGNQIEIHFNNPPNNLEHFLMQKRIPWLIK